VPPYAKEEGESARAPGRELDNKQELNHTDRRVGKRPLWRMGSGVTEPHKQKSSKFRIGVCVNWPSTHREGVLEAMRGTRVAKLRLRRSQ